MSKYITSAKDFTNAYVFFELHNIKKSEIQLLIVVDVHNTLYMLSNGLVVHYIPGESPRLFLPRYEMNTFTVESPRTLTFDKFTEIVPLNPSSIIVRVAWFPQMNKWIIGTKHNIQSSHMSCKNSMSFGQIFDPIVKTLDTSKVYVYGVDACVTNDPQLICTYTVVGQTLRRELQQSSTINLKSIDDIWQYCNDEHTDIVYYHPRDGVNYIFKYNNTQESTTPSKHDHTFYLTSAQYLAKCNYVSTFYSILSSPTSITDIHKELSERCVPRNYLLENYLRELPNYILEIIIFGNNITTISPSSDEYYIASTVRSMTPFPLNTIDLVTNIIKVLSQTNPKIILSMIRNMNDGAKRNIT